MVGINDTEARERPYDESSVMRPHFVLEERQTKFMKHAEWIIKREHEVETSSKDISARVS